MKVLIVDNYDSFTYNLKHYFCSYTNDVSVIRNDAANLWSELEVCDKIVLSPGPGVPRETKNLTQIINAYEGRKPILGVCLGHQGIAEYFGETIINLDCVLHGKSMPMHCIKEDPLFTNLPKVFNVARYHSWSVSPALKTESQLEIIAIDQHKYPLAIRHKYKNIRGVQFHPESILTEHGKTIVKNWITNC